MAAVATMPRELMLVSNARKALTEAKTVDEVKQIRDKAAAVKLYLQQAGESLEVQNSAAEIKLRAERRAGELLAEMDKNKGHRIGADPKSAPAPPRLEDLGITHKQSSRWQQEASVPEEVFERHVETVKAAGKELTSSGLIKLARRQPVEQPAAEDVDNGPQFKEAIRIAKECEAREDATRIVTSLDELKGQQFGCIYADPPWQYGNQATRASTDNHYDTMTVDQLCEMPVAELAANDAHLHLWTTNAFIFESKRLIEAWGFEYRSMFIWAKTQMGIGNYWRVSHEILLLGIRGNAKRFNDRSLKSWGEFDRGPHSAKPEAIRGMVEKASSGPYLELFGRQQIIGWTIFGNQVSAQRRLA